MDTRDINQIRQRLQREGFSEVQIERLLEFKDYKTEQKQAELEDTYRRLKFVRWLYNEGKLTDHYT